MKKKGCIRFSFLRKVGKNAKMISLDENSTVIEKDRARLLSLLVRTLAFNSAEIAVAMELYDKTQKFCAKNGFREVAKIADYYHPGNDRITFCRRLT